MKKRISIIILLSLICIAFIFNREIFFKLQQTQIQIMKEFTISLKKHDSFYWTLLIFSYGLIHSLGPGHGKTFLLTMSIKHTKPVLILYSALIAYIQGLISFTIVYVIFGQNKAFDTVYIKYIDGIGKHLYGITLILLALINMVSELTEKHVKEKYFIIGVFFPCSGILSLLLALIILGHKEYLLPATFIMSTGIFFTLALFSLFIDKIKYSNNLKIKTDKIICLYYIVLLVIGIYVLVR